MVEYKFNGGNNFHAELLGGVMTVTYEKGGSEFMRTIVSGEVSDETRKSFYEESLTLCDGRQIKRIRDKIIIE